jgi:hypothetical protein
MQPGPEPKSGSCRGDVKLDVSSSYQENSRRLQIPACARQVSLTYNSPLQDDSFTGEIVVPLGGPSGAAPDLSTDAVPAAGSLAPHFEMVRSVKQAVESSGTASFSVGIQKLKDQTATITVQYAEIVTAKDGGGNALPVQAGNKVVVTQDTAITFQVRNYLAAKGVNVQAEGKNGTVSAGKLSFSTPFSIAKGAFSTPSTPATEAKN